MVQASEEKLEKHRADREEDVEAVKQLISSVAETAAKLKSLVRSHGTVLYLRLSRIT